MSYTRVDANKVLKFAEAAIDEIESDWQEELEKRARHWQKVRNDYYTMSLLGKFWFNFTSRGWELTTKLTTPIQYWTLDWHQFEYNQEIKRAKHLKILAENSDDGFVSLSAKDLVFLDM